MLTIEEDLSGYERRPMPPGVALTPDSRVAVCPKGGYLWVVTPTAPNTAKALLPDASGHLQLVAEINDPLIGAPTAVEADDRGHVFLLCDGSVREYLQALPGGPFGYGGPDSYFGMDRRSVGSFAVLRSRNNIDPDIHDALPDWGDVLPTEGGAAIVECLADYNGVDGVTVQDIYDFLADWQNLVLRANINGLNGLTVQDIYDFLALWAAGCPR